MITSTDKPALNYKRSAMTDRPVITYDRSGATIQLIQYHHKGDRVPTWQYFVFQGHGKTLTSRTKYRHMIGAMKAARQRLSEVGSLK